MARYTIRIRTPRTRESAFEFLADPTNFPRWDPSISEARPVRGVERAVGSEYDVTADGRRLRYRITDFRPPGNAAIEARSRVVTSRDEMSVTDEGDHRCAIYDARLVFRGPLRILDPLLGLYLRRSGRRAAPGLAEALAGERVG